MVLVATIVAAATSVARGADQIDLEGDAIVAPLRSGGAVEWLFPHALCETTERIHSLKAPCVAMFDPATWRIKWTRTVASSPRHGAAIAGDWVVVDTGSKVLTILERLGGRLYWEVELEDDVAAPPEPLGNAVAVRDGERSLWLLDLEARRRAWVFRSDRPIRGRPVLAGSQVLVETAAGLVAVNHRTGDRIWQRPEATGGIVVAEGLVFSAVPNESRKSVELMAIDLVSGTIVWRVATAPGESGPAMVCGVQGGVALIAKGVVYGVDASMASGQIRFRQEIGFHTRVMTCQNGVAAIVEEDGDRSRVSMVGAEGTKPVGGTEMVGLIAPDLLADQKSIALVATSVAEPRRAVVLDTTTGVIVWQVAIGPRATLHLWASDGLWVRDSGELVKFTRNMGEPVMRRMTRIMRSGGGWSRGVRYVVYVVPPSLIGLGFLIHALRRRRERI